MKAKNFFHASCGMIGTTLLYLAAFRSVNTLIYQLPHSWEASDGLVLDYPLGVYG